MGVSRGSPFVSLTCSGNLKARHPRSRLRIQTADNCGTAGQQSSLKFAIRTVRAEEIAKGSAMAGTAESEAGLRQSRETMVLAHMEAENHRDLDATLATFKAGAARLELPGGEVADGPGEVADTYRELFAGFPDFSFPDLEPGSLSHHGDLVIAESRLQGTHLGTFRGLPPTGRRIDVPVVGIFEFDGPYLLCERAYFDRLTLFIQLGVARDPNTRAGKLTTLLNHPVTLARAALRSRRIISR